MKSLLGRRARTLEPSPLEGSGAFRALQIETESHQLTRSEWWLWLSGVAVTLLAASGLVLSSPQKTTRRSESLSGKGSRWVCGSFRLRSRHRAIHESVHRATSRQRNRACAPRKHRAQCRYRAHRRIRDDHSALREIGDRCIG